ncbi:hypothetical protein D3C84_866930 [compost metagenome]
MASALRPIMLAALPSEAPAAAPAGPPRKKPMVPPRMAPPVPQAVLVLLLVPLMYSFSTVTSRYSGMAPSRLVSNARCSAFCWVSPMAFMASLVSSPRTLLNCSRSNACTSAGRGPLNSPLTKLRSWVVPFWPNVRSSRSTDCSWSWICRSNDSVSSLMRLRSTLVSPTALRKLFSGVVSLSLRPWL